MTPLAFFLDGGAPVAPDPLPSLVVDPTDIAALVFMALFAMRRIEVRTTDPRAFPDVPRAEFDAWKAKALQARNVSVNACFGKFALNTIWFYAFREYVTIHTVQTVGAVLFFGWIAALSYAFWLSSAANTRAKRLGIVVGRRIIEEQVPRAPQPDGATATPRNG